MRPQSYLISAVAMLVLLPACSTAGSSLSLEREVVPAVPKSLATAPFRAVPCAAAPATPAQKPASPGKAAVSSTSRQTVSIAKKKGGESKGPRKNGSKKRKEIAKSRVPTEKAVVMQQVEEAVQRPRTSLTIQGKTIYNYIPDALYLVYAAINHVVDLELQPGEVLTGRIVAGDTYRWEVGTVVDGSGARTTTHVLLKPKQSGIETNFLIVTDRHSYRLYVRSNADLFLPAVGWSYPDEEVPQTNEVKKEQQHVNDVVAAPAIIAALLNFKYEVKADGRYPWTPLRAFDDGSRTYIQMSPAMKSDEAPVFFIREGEDLNLVNYRVRGDYFIVDRLFQEGELRSGKKDVVRIIKEKPS